MDSLDPVADLPEAPRKKVSCSKKDFSAENLFKSKKQKKLLIQQIYKIKVMFEGIGQNFISDKMTASQKKGFVVKVHILEWLKESKVLFSNLRSLLDKYI